MKILHIYDEHAQVLPGQGSVPTVIFYIAKHIVEKGHDITVLERRWNGLDYEEEIDGIRFERIDLIGSNIPYKEVPYEEVKSPSGLLRLILDRTRFALKANKYLKKNDFDVVHVHLPFTANILIILNRKLRKKMVYTGHIGEEKKRFNLDSGKGTPLLLKLFSPDLYLMKRVRKNVILNDPLKSKLVLKGVKDENLKVIPNGVDVREFCKFREDEIKKIKNKYGVEGKNIVMFAGTITPRKGVEYLLKAADLIVKSGYKDILFLFTGMLSLDSGFVERMRELIRICNLERYVKFTDIVPYDDLKVLYSACDVFVLPSFGEGDPIALKEALASEKPLIGTNVGGIPAQIKDGWNGFLIEPANEKQLAEKIKYLVDNEEERIRMGKNSRKLAEEEFDWRTIAERYLGVYKEVVR